MSLPSSISLTALHPEKPAKATSGPATGVPMTMPAILRNPRIKAIQQPRASAPRTKEKLGADGLPGPGGKRRRRRHENAQLAGNPHITRPSRGDIQPGPPKVDNTTFAPPPPSFPRSLYVPASTPVAAAPSQAGQFNLSLRGARKELRRMMGQHIGAEKRGDGGRVEELLKIMESELREWCSRSGRVDPAYYHSSPLGALGHGGRMLDPTPVDLGWSAPPPAPSLPDLPASSPSAPSPPPPSLTELSRTPQQLTWLLPSPHSRYLAHLLARYYSLQSFSRPLSPLQPEIRITHIVRAQLAQPLVGRTGGMAGMGLDTPPGTDWSDVGATTGVDTTSGSELDPSRAPSEFDSSDFDSEQSDYEDAREGRPTRPPGTLRLGEELIIRSSIPSYTPSDFESEEGGTGDERSSFASDSSDAEADDDGEGVDSLASSFADLRPSAPSAPFSPLPVAVAEDGTSTPRPLPLRQRLPRESFPPPSSPTPRQPARAASPETSLSRSASPTPAAPSSGSREAAAASRSREWQLPEQKFVEWLFA